MSKGYCNIKGRGIKFCQGSISELAQKKATLTDDQVNAWGAYWLVHFGLVGNCVVKQQEVDFTFEETVDWFETLTEDEVLQIKAAYESTQDFAKNIVTPEPIKKKKK